ncbi:MAG TPA: 6-pyruvoyl-tetrahydropterin synthase-related protein [Blastocatellia bacterium]|nr:6-pyruvoyl-tetrahydropterin synthase-related protein [Blastocatellia bacterium]
MKTRTAISVTKSQEPRAGSSFRSRLLVAALCVMLSALITIPFFFMAEPPPGEKLWMPVTHDMLLHYDQMRSFYQGIRAGEIYPRWEEGTNRGFGAPSTSYYPPGVYYLTSALYALTGDWMVSLMVLHLVLMIASAAAIYLYACRFMNRGAAVAAMAAYILLPYHIIDQYQRGAMAELLGFVWMPLMLLFGERLFRGLRSAEPERPRSASRTMLNIVGLAAVFGAFLWSHPPTAYQFTLAFALFSLALAVALKEWRGLALTGCAMAIGLGIAGAYFYPAMVEQGLIRREHFAEHWPYHNTYVFVHALHYADAHRGFFNLIDFTWIFNAVAILMGVIVLVFLESRYVTPTRGLKERVLIWSLIGFSATMMMTKVSYPIGLLIPKIETGVFSWRMLSITTLVAALLAGACVQAAYNALKQEQKRDSNTYVSLAALIIIGGAAFMAVKLLPPLYLAPPFETASEHLNYAMVPRTAPADPMEMPRVDRAELASGKGQVTIERWDPQYRSLRVELSEPDRLLIRTFNFPGWVATVDGQPAAIQTGEALRIKTDGPEQELIRAATYRGGPLSIDGLPARIIGSESLGDMVIELSPGDHQVTLEYLDTPARRTGALVTMTALSILLILALTAIAMRLSAKSEGRISDGDSNASPGP